LAGKEHFVCRKLNQQIKMKNEFKNCQSCGMPLKRDPKGGGANADGSISKMYCSYCYANGEFIYKGNDVREFQELNKQKMMEGGHSKFFAWLFTRGMKRLGRWKNK
jgi:hypothetical protein